MCGREGAILGRGTWDSQAGPAYFLLDLGGWRAHLAVGVGVCCQRLPGGGLVPPRILSDTPPHSPSLTHLGQGRLCCPFQK